MRTRWILPVFTSIFIIVVLSSSSSRAADEKAALEKKREELRAKGFKTDLSDFNFSASPEEFKRSQSIRTTDPLLWRRANNRGSSASFTGLKLRTLVTSNTVLVVWNLRSLADQDSPETDWQTLQETFAEHTPQLDELAQSLAKGPYAFDLQPRAGTSMLLPHLAQIKSLTQAFAAREMLELHEGRSAAAWSNLLTATRLSTRWRVEPVEISYMVRHACATIAFDAAWQALQTNCWTDEHLLALQKEWESVDWFRGLDEMAAFDGASAANLCQLERTNSLSLQLPIRDALRHPTDAINEVKYYRQQKDYQEHGSYEDEKGLLEFFYQRQQDTRRALECKTWADMQRSPGVTNLSEFQSKYRSHVQSRLQMQTVRHRTFSLNGQPQTIIGRAAEMESRGRVLVTAVALERFRLRHHDYPARLAQLAPDFLNTEPLDFCDGKPLRYRVEQPRYVLYSIGLDGVDDGGALADQSMRQARQRMNSPKHLPEDIVWARPPTAEDMRERERELARQNEEQLMKGIEWRRRAALENKTRVEELSRLYGRPRIRMTNEPTYAGRPLKGLLGIRNSLGRTNASLEELLTLKQVKSNQEPEVVTFELPIQYDVLTNLGSLQLLIDPEVSRAVRTWDTEPAAHPEFHRVIEGSNGLARIEWSTIFIPPGKHFLMTEFAVEGRQDTSFSRDEWYVVHGPMIPFEITNVCYFDIVSTTYDPTNGGPLYAFVAESNATYKAELKAPSGKHIRSFQGTITNGIMDIRWDAKDEDGHYYGNGWVDTFFDVVLTDSGRHQRLKGP
ncbi:MAG: hypothetical protein JWO95_2756 [Verrucomicrobiales bacterium]|nr:hypothetical protein [Verrucomicrobiales bacterium]